MKNIAASVLAKLKNVSKARGMVYNEVLVRYGIERTLKRLERSSYVDSCVLKGGTMFLVWNKGLSFRPTMDADIEFRGEASTENLKRVFIEIASMSGEEEDGFCIDNKSIQVAPIREDDEYGGMRVNMTAKIGSVRIPVQFDVGIGDAITPVPKKDIFPTLLDLDPPRIKVYPRETMIAEKFQTIVKRGLANSRMKDYYDLWKLSEDDQVDMTQLKKAIMRTFERRETDIPQTPPLGLSTEFTNDSNKRAQWMAFLRKNRLDVEDKSFETIVASIHEFIYDRVLK